MSQHYFQKKTQKRVSKTALIDFELWSVSDLQRDSKKFLQMFFELARKLQQLV